jgi:hypothetical protein
MTDPPIAAAGPPSGGPGSAPAPTRSDRSPWNWLLLIPIVLPLLTFVYNREAPNVAGFPFFFWFQLLFPPLAVAVTTAVFLLAKKRRA